MTIFLLQHIETEWYNENVDDYDDDDHDDGVVERACCNSSNKLQSPKRPNLLDFLISSGAPVSWNTITFNYLSCFIECTILLPLLLCFVPLPLRALQFHLRRLSCPPASSIPFICVSNLPERQARWLHNLEHKKVKQNTDTLNIIKNVDSSSHSYKYEIITWKLFLRKIVVTAATFQPELAPTMGLVNVQRIAPRRTQPIQPCPKTTLFSFALKRAEALRQHWSRCYLSLVALMAIAVAQLKLLSLMTSRNSFETMMMILARHGDPMMLRSYDGVDVV